MDALPTRFAASQLPIAASAGVGLRPVHYQQILTEGPAVAWFEVHSQNYFGAGGQLLHYLDHVRDLYPLSLHGVGLFLGSTGHLDNSHLQRALGSGAPYRAGSCLRAFELRTRRGKIFE